MNVEQLFGEIENAEWNGEDAGFLKVRLCNDRVVHLWFNDLSQLGNVHIGDVETFMALPINNKMTNSSYKLISHCDAKATIAYLLQNNQTID